MPTKLSLNDGVRILTKIRKPLDVQVQQYNYLTKQCKQIPKEIAKLADLECEIAEAVVLLQSAAKLVQNEAREHLTAVINRSLEIVFDEPYICTIVFKESRGSTSATIEFERDGNTVDPMTASGGGVVDVAAFAIRLSCILYARPKMRRLMILDEPMKFVSATHRERVRIVLETLAHEFDFQFIIVTHVPELEIGKVIRL